MSPPSDIHYSRWLQPDCSFTVTHDERTLSSHGKRSAAEGEVSGAIRPCGVCPVSGAAHRVATAGRMAAEAAAVAPVASAGSIAARVYAAARLHSGLVPVCSVLALRPALLWPRDVHAGSLVATETPCAHALGHLSVVFQLLF